MEKCSACGAPMDGGKCGYCGGVKAVGNGPAVATASQPVSVMPQINIINQQQSYNTQNSVSQPTYAAKSKMMALLLCFFLGVVGAHRFYLGNFGIGLVYLFTGGLFGFGALYDFIMLILGKMKDSNGYPLV